VGFGELVRDDWLLDTFLSDVFSYLRVFVEGTLRRF